MDCGYTTSDLTSSGSSFSSPPPTTRSLPQNTRGKMTCRTRSSSSKEASSSSANEIFADSFVVLSSLLPKMSAKSIVKTINRLGLPKGFKILTPIEYQRANNPPPGCVTVYAAQCVSGLRFSLHPFLVDLLVTLGIPPSQLKPNSYRLVVGFLLCCQLYHIEPTMENFLGVFVPRLTPEESEWEVPLIWRSSLNDFPSINFELVKERVKAAGLLDHGFKAKALVEEDLLILAGLYPVPDTYTGPVSRYFRLQTMMNRAAVRKFLPENVPSNPLSSSSTRSVSATPSDIQSSGRGRSPSRTPPIARPSSISPSSPPIGQAGPSLETPVIEVETSPQGDTIHVPSSPPFVPQSKVGSSSQKRPRIEEAPQVEEVLSSDPPPTAASASFPLPVMTLQFNPNAGVSNMCKAANKDDVEFLSGRSMESLGHLILSQTAMTPPIVMAMIERFDKMRANLEAALAQLKGGRIQVESLKKQLADEKSKSREEISSLRAQLEEKDRQMSVQAMEMESLRTTSLQSYSRGREEGLQAGHSAVVAAYKASPEYAEEVFRQGSSFYADGFTVCAEQFKNLGNLPPDFDFNFLDMRVDGFDRIGGVGPSE
ncbi:hypothetical protein Salat_0868900 [Sesamum alatum]|uniref:Transposase (putative) gypsy type domain-containing protein n=1 Tax=Sesamum alatum TaxID=300844 RepID=A0AAE1YIT9_9LAMI|nr:hypothetical protein Salat_0868900 [Sesamum alatum]